MSDDKERTAMRYTYPARFTDEGDGFSVSFPDFKGVLSEGDDFGQAANMGAEALGLGIMHCLENGLGLPEPSVAAEGCVLLSVEVDWPEDGGAALVSAGVAAMMLGTSENEVRRMIGAGQLAAKSTGWDNYVYTHSVNEAARAAEDRRTKKGAACALSGAAGQPTRPGTQPGCGRAKARGVPCP